MKLLMNCCTLPVPRPVTGHFERCDTRNAADPLVRGEYLGGEFAYHVINSDGPAMIHISKALRPEVVVFGQDQGVVPPAFLFAGQEIMIKGLADGRVKLTRFGVGDAGDQQETCDAKLDDSFAVSSSWGEAIRM